MAYNFSNSTILVVNDVSSTRKVLSTALKIHQAKAIYEAQDGMSAFSLFKEHKPDIVITELQMEPLNGIQLAKKIRSKQYNSPNRETPIILTTPNADTLSVPDIRDSGFTELLLIPFSVDSIAKCIAYVLNTPRTFIEVDDYTGPDRRRKDDPDYAGPFRRPGETPQETQAISTDKQEKPSEQTMPWPNTEDSKGLMNIILEHYNKHHEIVLRKLRHTQNATQQSIQDIDGQADKVHELTDFDKMWNEVIEMFLKSGASEEDVFKIESLITTIPQDIKTHYEHLVQEDKNLMTLIESLDTDAYHEARASVTKLEKEPNLMSGLKPEEYELKDNTDTESGENDPDRFKILKIYPREHNTG